MSTNNINNKQAIGLLFCGIGSLMAILAYFLNTPMYLPLISAIVFLIGVYQFMKSGTRKR